MIKGHSFTVSASLQTGVAGLDEVLSGFSLTRLFDFIVSPSGLGFGLACLVDFTSSVSVCHLSLVYFFAGTQLGFNLP